MSGGADITRRVGSKLAQAPIGKHALSSLTASPATTAVYYSEFFPAAQFISPHLFPVADPNLRLTNLFADVDHQVDVVQQLGHVERLLGVVVSSDLRWGPLAVDGVVAGEHPLLAARHVDHLGTSQVAAAAAGKAGQSRTWTKTDAQWKSAYN